MGTIPATSLRSYEEVDSKLFQYAQIQAKIAKKEADMNSVIQKAKDKYNDETLQDRAEVEFIKKDIEGYLAINKNDFNNVRTKKLVHGSVGFRFGKPKVLILSKKYNMNSVIELAKKLFKTKYIRTVEELNKEAILADHGEGKINDDKVAAMGLRVDKDESFVIEIDWETIETN